MTQGKVIDRSSPEEPLAYLHGHGNIVPGLERELTGRDAGDKVSVKVAPAEGYGEYDKALVQQVPKRSLQGIPNLKVGTADSGADAEGVRVFTVTRLVSDMVTIDGNHELAGKTLHFDVEIADVRRRHRRGALSRARARRGWASPLERRRRAIVSSASVRMVVPLALVTGTSMLAMDFYLPAVPALQKSFGVDVTLAQATVAVFLGGTRRIAASLGRRPSTGWVRGASCSSA